MFDKLFRPLSMGRATLPNRLCFLAHRTNFATNGHLGDRHTAYYRRRADGGCGLIIIGELCIHPWDMPWETAVLAYEPEIVPEYRKLTGVIHETGAMAFAQLNHHGFQSSGAVSRREVWGPSAVADIAFGEVAKSMEPEDMKTVSTSFAKAAALVREGGFDGLEIDMGAESLLRQFLSPISNLRQDAYGGGVENRMRFPLEVLTAVRKAVGSDFTVGVRLCVDEQFWGGITPEDGIEFATTFEKLGPVEFINATIGTYYNLHFNLASMHKPEGFVRDLAGKIRDKVGIPVISGHQISTPQTAEEILKSGQADAVGMVRALICDPDFPKKARQGRPEDIRTCARDNEACVGRIHRGRTLGCIQNASVGDERRPIRDPYTTMKKRVMVIGGGPAGLEAARSARLRGHDVVLYEKEEAIGGQVRLAQKGAGRQRLSTVIANLRRALEALEVPIHTGVEVTPELVMKLGHDAVVVATGSRPNRSPVPGSYGPPAVLTVWDVLEEVHPIGERVLFVDENGGHHAAATAEFLADRGRRVDMVTGDLFIGMELASIGDLYLTRQRLLQKRVAFRTDVVIDEIVDRTVRAHDLYTHAPVVLDGYHTIVLDMGNVTDDALYWSLKGAIKALYRVGDCVAPRGIEMAVREGNRVGGML